MVVIVCAFAQAASKAKQLMKTARMIVSERSLCPYLVQNLLFMYVLEFAFPLSFM